MTRGASPLPQPKTGENGYRDPRATAVYWSECQRNATETMAPLSPHSLDPDKVQFLYYGFCAPFFFFFTNLKDPEASSAWAQLQKRAYGCSVWIALYRMMMITITSRTRRTSELGGLTNRLGWLFDNQDSVALGTRGCR